MMHLYWSTLLLCLSANAENMWRDSGENVTLKCSSAGCPSSIDGSDGMYLYQNDTEQNEVLYYHTYPGSTDKISPRNRYTGRIQTKGSLKNHTITISNLTVDDSGFYSCVYIKGPDDQVQCSVYTIFIRGVAPCSRPAEVPHAPSNQQSPPLVLVVIAACTISTLVTMIFILLIVPRVKRWTSSRRRTSVSNDFYEVMTRRLPSSQEQPSTNPYDCS